MGTRYEGTDERPSILCPTCGQLKPEQKPIAHCPSEAESMGEWQAQQPSSKQSFYRHISEYEGWLDEPATDDHLVE